jgi:hypothetical protein
VAPSAIARRHPGRSDPTFHGRIAGAAPHRAIDAHAIGAHREDIMRFHAVVPAALLVGVAAAVGCRQSEQSRTQATATTKPAAVATTRAETTLSAGAIGMRSEAQDHFDRSRAAFLKKDMKTASTELRDAAAFMRQRADSATGFAKALSSRSARELDSLATTVGASSVKSAASLDHVFAHANRAEAERHYEIATRAWKQHQTTRTGEELTMAMDHLERAAKDAHISLDSAATRAMDRSRAVADSLLQGGTAPNGVDDAFKDLELQLRRFGAQLENQRM